VTDRAAAPAPLWVLYCDGSALPNPGRMGLGAVWTEPDGTHHTLSQAAPTKGCNNEAQLRALMAALAELQRRGARALLVHCDSTIVVGQLGSKDAKPIARLAGLFEQARQLLGAFDHARLQWIPRQRNGQADALARAALGIVSRQDPTPRKQ
jgi:ribonuclease HI